MNNSQFVPQIACIAASIWQKNQNTQRCPQQEKIKMWSEPNATPDRVTVQERNWLPGLDWTAWNRCETNKSIHHIHIYFQNRNGKWKISNLYLKL